MVIFTQNNNLYSMACGKVYKITNLINGKVYIGQTTRNIYTRFIEHCSQIHNNYAISNAILKYGRKNFKIEVLETAQSIDDLNKKEEFWIEKLNSTDKSIGYNIKLGGDNKLLSKVTKNKISQAHLGKLKGPHSNETRQKISKALKNKPKTDEHKKKLSVVKIGKKHSESAKIKMSKNKLGNKNAFYNKTHSEETKLKLAQLRSIPIICNETQMVFKSTKHAAEFLSCHPSSIAAVISGKSKTCKGFTFSKYNRSESCLQN